MLGEHGSMNCAMCDAPAGRSKTHCSICGYARAADAARTWNREPEATAVEDVHAVLEEGETLLAVTRGRATGPWKGRGGVDPRALLSPFVNVALTAERLLIQPVHPSSGRAIGSKAATCPLGDVLDISVSDADPMEEGRTTRVVVTDAKGELIRMRATGRFADSARELAEVWESLAPQLPRTRGTTSGDHGKCRQCGRRLDGRYRFCPFCGGASGDEKHD